MTEMARDVALKLAHQLEWEYPCEHCHDAPATEMFDRKFVCSPCRQVLLANLVKNG